MTNTEYLKTLMISRLGTGDDESAEIINNMVDSASVGASVGAPIYETNLDADLPENKTQDSLSYEWQFSTPLPIFDFDKTRMYKIVFDYDESKPIYMVCENYASSHHSSIGNYNNPDPFYAMQSPNGRGDEVLWTIELTKWYINNTLGGVLPKHITITTSYIKSNLIASFWLNEYMQPQHADVDFNAIYRAVQSGTPYRAQLVLGNQALELSLMSIGDTFLTFSGAFYLPELGAGLVFAEYNPSDPDTFTFQMQRITE